jgi:hypothetical protein
LLSEGIEKYRPAAERDVDLAEYDALAAAGGTTLAEALRKYVGVEQRLRENPVAEICMLITKAGKDPVEFFRTYLDEHPAEPDAA